ncbi:MAG: hydrolase family protein, partial [Clostridia bacterium]|nr:hydrolase family protein [Clostridia bacterium]
VTYRHTDKWQGIIPIHKNGALPLFHKKLKNQENLTFGFLGDSITTGSNSSGRNNINIPPYIPSWPEVICESIENDYSLSVKYVNKAVGGTASRWGADKVKELFSDNIPDIFLIAFGMNDASCGVPKDAFITNIKEITDKMIEMNPKVEFIVVSTSLPNELASGFYRDHAEHEALLYKMSVEYGDKMIVSPVTAIHSELLKKKNYRDMTGNNVNHPNDYLSSVYAQTILSVII